MMINLVVLKIRLISGTKLENDGERIASYNQVFPDIKRFFSFSTILTILLQQMARLLGGKGEDMVVAKEADEDEGSSICL